MCAYRPFRIIKFIYEPRGMGQPGARHLPEGFIHEAQALHALSRFPPPPFMIMSILSIILPVLSLSVVRAAPWQTVHARQSNSDNSNTGSSPAIWVWISPSLVGVSC